MTRLSKEIVAAGALLALGLSACVHKSEEPGLTGPSTFATALNVSASPDLISLGNGASAAGETSTINVQVQTANGGSVPSGTSVRLDVMVGPTAQDCGQLSQRVLTIPSNGRATATFTAPGFPLPLPACANFEAGSTVTISATLVGSNFQSVTVPIRMIQQGVILPSPGTPTPQFSFFPLSPTVGASVQFDARLSCPGQTVNGACAPTGGNILSYQWNFGDGGTASGAIVYHTYSIPQDYAVTLTVTNDANISARISQPITVTTGEPIASFAYSPDTSVAHTLNFDASSSKAAPGSKITAYHWDFGDGSQQTTTIPLVAHTYANNLTRFVTLTVTDDVGRTSVAKSLQVTVP